MRIQDCFELGIVARLHGFNGQVQIAIDSDEPARYAGIDALFLEIRGQLVPFLVDKLEVSGARAIAKFKDINSEEEAERIRNAKVYLPLSLLPPLKDNQFYFHEIVGYQVQDTEQGPLGTVSTTYSMPTQDLIGMDYKGVEVLIPIADDIVLRVDRENKVLHVSLPEGLVEVYTEADGV